MQNYNFIQKFLHDLVLNKKFINKSLYEIEKIIYLKSTKIKDHSHIFITSLPRSGTTSLLNFIFSTNQYESLTYRNIPFVLSPNFSKLFNKKKIIRKERLHSDGIFYDTDSPEAFDEIFFKNDEKFIKNELENYIKLILFTGNKVKYLSKNNLNFKRINLIKTILPNSIFLITVRDPIQQSFSLLNQHLHFSTLQKKNDFIRRYMNYLGHNEFGLNHKPWNEPINFKNLNDINYWLEQWYLFYQKIYLNYKSYKNCFFLIYEKLSDPNYIESLLKKIGVNKTHTIDLNYFKNSNKQEVNKNFNLINYENAVEIYKKFTSIKI